MKKLTLFIVAVAGGLFVARKRRASQVEADLWHEATTGNSLR